jgi:uroporphyrin-III C-methyltransferase
MDIFRTHGKSDTPVAIIQNGTTKEEKMVIGTVKDIFFKASYEGIGNPSCYYSGRSSETTSFSLKSAITNIQEKVSFKRNLCNEPKQCLLLLCSTNH